MNTFLNKELPKWGNVAYCSIYIQLSAFLQLKSKPKNFIYFPFLQIMSPKRGFVKFNSLLGTNLFSKYGLSIGKDSVSQWVQNSSGGLCLNEACHVKNNEIV